MQYELIPNNGHAEKKLFVFYIGGSAGQSNIEVHDIQFLIGPTPESCFDKLKSLWFGTPESLHIDGYRELNWADGYQVTLTDRPNEQTQKLFFVNVGAYCASTLAELHAFDFFVAPNAAAAKQKALNTLLNGTMQKHKDDLVDVDNCLELKEIEQCYVHLTENPTGTIDKPLFQGYLPIGK